MAGLMLSGCPSVGIYRTARTLDPGVGDFGLAVNATRIQSASAAYTDESGNKHEEDVSSIVWPNLIPEANFHIGVVDDLEVGGRVALSSGLIELDAKYRFLQAADNKLHMATQPAVGYRSLFALEGVSFTLPLVLTYDVTSFLAVTAFGYGSYLDISPVDDSLDIDLATNSMAVGGGIGLEFRGDTFYVMPVIDVSRTMMDMSSDGNKAETDFTFMTFGVAFGWLMGKEKQQLDRIENKLDKIDKKLD